MYICKYVYVMDVPLFTSQKKNKKNKTKLNLEENVSINLQ